MTNPHKKQQVPVPKITASDMMYFIETVANDSEQNSAFRLEAIITLLQLGGYTR